MNFFDKIEHALLGKTKPGYESYRPGEVILEAGKFYDRLQLLRWGRVIACEDGSNGTVSARYQTRSFSRNRKDEPVPVFGAKDFYGCELSSATYIAETAVEIMTLGSENLIHLGRKEAIFVVARELIRDSDLSEELLPELIAEYERTGLPGYDPSDPRDILTKGAMEHHEAYVEYAQNLMKRLTLRRIKAAGDTSSIRMPELSRSA